MFNQLLLLFFDYARYKRGAAYFGLRTKLKRKLGLFGRGAETTFLRPTDFTDLHRRLQWYKCGAAYKQTRYVELDLFSEEKEDYLKDSVSSENKESVTSPDKEYDLTDLFERLSKSAFRSRFHLSKRDKEYIAEKGLATIRKHAEDFVAKRLAPAVIPNDGKQTPMRGHPVFIAQHATGCCCRGCFFKWHHIPAGRQMTREEQQYAVAVLMAWIEKQV